MKFVPQRAILSFTVITFGLVVLTMVPGCNHREINTGKESGITSANSNPVAEPYSKIKSGMTYPEVLAILGKPASQTGSGISILTYNISSTEQFIVHTTGAGEQSRVIGIYHTDTKK